MKIVGHTDCRTTADICAHVRDEMLKKATLNMAKVFGNRQKGQMGRRFRADALFPSLLYLRFQIENGTMQHTKHEPKYISFLIGTLFSTREARDPIK